MGRRTIKKKSPSTGRPSTFFLIALALGVLIIAFIFMQAISHPAR
jgi:hypothetical protein